MVGVVGSIPIAPTRILEESGRCTIRRSRPRAAFLRACRRRRSRKSGHLAHRGRAAEQARQAHQKKGRSGRPLIRPALARSPSPRRLETRDGRRHDNRRPRPSSLVDHRYRTIAPPGLGEHPARIGDRLFRHYCAIVCRGAEVDVADVGQSALAAKRPILLQ